MDEMIIYYLGFVIIILLGLILFAWSEIWFKIQARSLAKKGKTVIFLINSNRVIEPKVVTLNSDTFESDKENTHMILKSDQYRYNNLPAYIIPSDSAQTISVENQTPKLSSSLLKQIILKAKATSLISSLMKDIQLQKVLAIATVIGVAVILYYGWQFMQDLELGKYCFCMAQKTAQTILA